MRLYFIHSIALVEAFGSVPHANMNLSPLTIIPKNAILPIKNVAAKKMSATNKLGSFACSSGISFFIPTNEL